MEELKKQIEFELDDTGLRTKNGKAFPLRDFFSVCCALPGGFSSLGSAPLSAKQRIFVGHAAAISGVFLKEMFSTAMKWLDTQITMRLMFYSRIEGQVFGCHLEDLRLTPGKPPYRLTLINSEPRAIQVDIGGQVRPAYQCAIPTAFKGIRWVECDGDVFRLHSGRQYPIYLQSHALRRLRERLAVNRIPEVTLHLGLMESLAVPKIIKGMGDSYLIEFHLRGIRVGYLVARVIRNTVLITTFLLLTMEGTPENRLLRQKLHLTRQDIEYEGLDRLETYLSPDILADHGLVNVLEECGCGSLLALARDGFPHNAEGGRAEDLKRFLRIADSDDGKLCERLQSCLPRKD